MGKIGYKKPVDRLEKIESKTVDHKHVPGRAFEITDPVTKLISTIGQMFNEPRYYKSGRSYADFMNQLFADGKITRSVVDTSELNEQAREIIETAKSVADTSPEDLLVILAWARDPKNGLKLRSTPATLFAVAAAHKNTRPFLQKYVRKVLTRADDIRSVFAAYTHLFTKTGQKRTLPTELKKSLAIALSNQSAYSLIKYNDNNHPTFRDVVAMIKGDRIRSVVKDTSNGWPFSKGLYEYLSFGKVTENAPEIVRKRAEFFKNNDIKKVSLKDIENAGLTWENVISHFKSSREAWELVIPVMGEMALTRNLRNFEQAGITPEAWKKVFDTILGVEKTVQLPFRFFAAVNEVSGSHAKSVVELALDKSINNLPELPGTTVVLVDNSGSAVGARISSKSNMKVSDTGNMLAAIAAKRFGLNCVVGVFGDSLVWVPFSVADSTMQIKRTIDSKAQIEERSKNNALAIHGYKKGSGVGMGTETGLWWAIHDLTERGIKVDRFILLSDLCCYTQGDVNCGLRMSDYFGTNSSMEGMFEKYRRKVNTNVKVYSVNLAGYSQSQVDDTRKNNYLLSGFSEQLYDLIYKMEGGQQGEAAALPTIEQLRLQYSC